jgi:hypothetical protein
MVHHRFPFSQCQLAIAIAGSSTPMHMVDDASDHLCTISHPFNLANFSNFFFKPEIIKAKI